MPACAPAITQSTKEVDMEKVPKYGFWGRMGNVLWPMINVWTYEQETRKHFERLHANHRLDPPNNVILFPQSPRSTEQGKSW